MRDKEWFLGRLRAKSFTIEEPPRFNHTGTVVTILHEFCHLVCLEDTMRNMPNTENLLRHQVSLYLGDMQLKTQKHQEIMALAVQEELGKSIQDVAPRTLFENLAENLEETLNQVDMRLYMYRIHAVKAPARRARLITDWLNQ